MTIVTMPTTMTKAMTMHCIYDDANSDDNDKNNDYIQMTMTMADIYVTPDPRTWDYGDNFLPPQIVFTTEIIIGS